MEKTKDEGSGKRRSPGAARPPAKSLRVL